MSRSDGTDDSEAIVAYIRSPDAVRTINHDGLISNMLADRKVDIFARFPSLWSGHSTDDFVRHFKHFVDVKFNRATNITSIEAQGFSAPQAAEIAKRLLAASETMVNRLNDRARLAIVASAERDVADASTNLAMVLRQMTAARTQQRLIAPELEAGAAVKLSSATAAELSDLNIQLFNTIRATPNSPRINSMRARRSAIEAELARQINGQVDGPSGLSNRMRELDEIDAKRSVAEKRLLGASIGLVTAKGLADRQKLYLELINNPSVPDEPRYPRSIRNVLLTLAVSVALYWIVLSLSELVFNND